MSLWGSIQLLSLLLKDKHSCQKTAKGQKNQAKPHHTNHQTLKHRGHLEHHSTNRMAYI